MKELDYMSDAYVEKVKLHQLSAHAVYDMHFGFNGKKTIKQSELRKMFPLLYKEEKVMSPDDANAALLQSGLVKK